MAAEQGKPHRNSGPGPKGPRPNGGFRSGGSRPDGSRSGGKGFGKGPRPDGGKKFDKGSRRDDGKRFDKGDRSGAPRRDGDKKFGDKRDGYKKFDGEKRDGFKKFDGERRDGDFRPKGDRRDGDFRPRSPRPDGDKRYGDRKFGDKRSDGKGFGKGPRPDGDKKFDKGPRRDGDFRPKGDRRDGDFRSKGDRSGAPRRDGDFRPRGPRPQKDDRFDGEFRRDGDFRPKSDRPASERPKSDRPKPRVNEYSKAPLVRAKTPVSRSDAAVASAIAAVDHKPYGADLRGTVKSGRPGAGRRDGRFGDSFDSRDRKPKAKPAFDNLPEPDKIIMVTCGITGNEVPVAVHDAGSEQFAARLKKVAKDRRKWAAKEDISCYRIYDADLPDFSVAIDRYDGVWKSEGESYLCIAEYQAPGMIDPAKVAARFADVVAIAPVVLGIPAEHVFTKTRRREKGGGQYTDQQKESFVAYTQEAGNVMQIDLGSYLDTGIFLDHRVTRCMVGEMAEGKNFLNLFSYTGTCTVHAAVGGARTTTTVDLSQTYLNWAKRNMELNGCTGAQHRFERADVLQWIVAECETPHRYDLIFVDPPTFSNSKSMGDETWSVQRDHVRLLTYVTQLLAPGGKAVFSCNLRDFKPEHEELAKAGVALEDITEQTIPQDFERNPKIHKCYIVTRLED